ncbi:MAG TPA: gamma-glutamylcyclotransferase family protein [Terracidiphilus sp.]|nr:gamma-glutamylcyclotransferase family protein [Terracidiphilus sp.]
MTEYLFAYGTLQPGLVPASMSALAGKLTPIGKGFVRGVLYGLGRYPGAIPDAASPHQIAGTVLELPDDENILPKLDAYEGFDPASPASSEYIRERQTVKLADGRTLDCWFYRYNFAASPSQIIVTGVWPKRRNDTAADQELKADG